MSLRVVKPGLLTTVQDSGRWGYQNLGVPVAGPMDRMSHRLANLIVGNPAHTATLEVTLIGPDIEFGADTLMAVTGADFELTIDGRPVPSNTAVRAPKGSRLVFGERRRGARAYLAVAGGADVPAVLGSRATHLASRMGGHEGRALRAGDELPLGPGEPDWSRVGHSRRAAIQLPAGGVRVRVMRGPQDELFTDAAFATLAQARYLVTSQSNRMGYRLEGPPLEHGGNAETISDATAVGTLQVPAAGQPILLMAECQTAGGYPKLATVITADLPLAGQLAPGEWIEFEWCGRREALTALIAQERILLA